MVHDSHGDLIELDCGRAEAAAALYLFARQAANEFVQLRATHLKDEVSKRTIPIFFLLVFCGTQAIAQDRMQAAQAAVKNMAEETLECAAYFDIVSLALLNSQGGDIAQEYIKARKLAVDRAESLSQGILSVRYHVLVGKMKRTIMIANAPRRIDENLSNVTIENVSVLRDRYAKLCKEVLDNPGARAKYWMEQPAGPS